MNLISTRLKRIAAIIVACTLVCTAVGFSELNAFAAEASVPTAEWEMTVPQIRVTTENGNGCELQKDDGYQSAEITITDTDGTVLSDSCKFKVRGNTTALSWVTKKAFTFKFEKKKDVLGMGKGKKWVLLANAFDPTLLRNYTAFALADELGLEYTSQSKFTELWVDGVFRGCYQLYEPVQEGKERVDIDIEGNDGKKDFLVELERLTTNDDETYFTTDSLRFVVKEPEEPNEEQLEYIQSTMHNVITAIRSGDRRRTEQVLDVESFAKFFVLNEFMKTYDFNTSSVNFYYKDGKLYAGPPWDYDMSSGNTDPTYSERAAQVSSPEDVFASKYNICKYLSKNDWFIAAVKQVYHQHFDFISSIGADGGLLDTARERYSDIFARNYGEAGWYVGKWWINYQLRPKTTYDANFTVLKDWCAARSAWMAEYYGEPTGEFLLGDADLNGMVNISDVTKIQRLLAEFEVSDREACELRADIDGDGSVTIEDGTLLQRHLAEFYSVYPIGQVIIR